VVLPTLHEAMVEALRRSGGGWIGRDQLARVITEEDLWRRPSDGLAPPSDQLRLRARKYSHLFEVSDTAATRIRLAGRAAGSTPAQHTPKLRSSSGDSGRRRPSLDSATRVTSDEAMKARARRTRAARRFKPSGIDLLLVAEAPPAALDRYFYFTDVAEQDSLFRSIVRSTLKTEPTRADKSELLGQLRDRSIFLIDLKLDPVDG
jgi:hypothetical protein